MRIGVARGATAIFKMKGRYFVGGVRDTYLVAVAAGNGDMRASQGELGLSMLRDGKKNAVEILDGVAGFAAIVVRGGSKLTGMDVLVAVHTVCEFHVVKGGLAGGKVALRAFHLAVFALEGVARGGMLLYSKQRRLPAVNSVALRAFSFFLAAGELTLVDVFVAVGAIRKSE